MGIIQTDQWLKRDFDSPVKICERLLPYFQGRKPKEIYSLLMKFGMYRPSWQTKNNFKQMVDDKAWNQVELLLEKYQKKWSGPDIPIFLFPLNQTGGFFFRRDTQNKSGVSFHDKMFLFLSEYDDPLEIEALFVHEYHHVCRLRKTNKKDNEFTLLDSLIIEGLAEYAVLKNCGKEYLAKWCHMYSEMDIAIFWERFLEQNLAVRKKETLHDELLYGGRRVPPLLGYAAGYNIINKFYRKHNYSEKLTFHTPSENYIE